MMGAGVRYTHPLTSRISFYCRTTWQFHNSSVDWTRKLLKPSKYAAGLLVGIKKLENFGFQVFCGWCHKWNRFLHHFGPGYLALGTNCQLL